MTRIPAKAEAATADSVGLFRSHATKCALLILAAVFIANLNVLWAGFVWDDKLLIVGNIPIKHLRALPDLLLKPFLDVYYRPVVMLSFALEYAVWGLRPWGFHLTNLLLHAANSCLVFVLLREISTDRRAALFAALIFAVHPAHKGVVAINDRTGLLAALFFLGSLILYIRHRRIVGGGRSWLYYGASCLLFLLGLFSKEEALTLPLMLVVIDIVFLDRQRESLRPARIVGYAPFFLSVAAYFWVRARVISGGPGLASAFAIEPVRRLMTVPAVLVDYLLVLLFPIRLDYDPITLIAASPGEPRILLPMLLLVALAAAIPFLVRKTRKGAFGLLWYFLVFIPMCNIVPIYPEVAHVQLTTPIRYLYLPSIGVFLCAGLIFERILCGLSESATGARLGKPALISFCCVVLIFSLLSIKRNTLWKDDVRFYRYVLEMNPENSRMRFNLGTVYLQRGEVDAAIRELSRAATLAPALTDYRNNLALAYKAKGWLGRAVEEFQQALRLDPNSAKAYTNLGPVYRMQGKIPEAIAAGEKAVELAPLSYIAQANLAETYDLAGNPAKAEKHYETAIRLNPGCFEARVGLASIYAESKRHSLARKEWEAALRIQPDAAEVRKNLQGLEGKGF